MKNEILKAHFLDPKNLGILEKSDFQSIAKSDTCNDVVKLMIKLDGDMVSEISAQVYGCGYCIAGSSLFTDTVKGVSISEAETKARLAIDAIKGDLSEHNIGCVSLPLKAFAALYENYRRNA